MLAEARAGRIHGLWIQGEDIVQSDPNEALVREAVDKLDLLIVQELFFTETARYAHLILPAAGVLEQEGTFTNGERRIQRVRPAVAPPGDARPDWEVVRDLARELGADWQYPNAGYVMEEIARVCPALFGGVSYARLGAGGLQWPCPNAMHPGSDRVHETEFVRGKGLFFAMDPLPSPELRAPQWPYLLITGRVLQQYNVGTMTRRTPNLQLAGHDQLVMHPDDAYREGLRHGQDVSVTSRYGQAATTLRISDTIRPGTLFLSFHFPDTHTNALTSGLVDPKSKCPDYKVTAVRVDAATGAGAARSGP
jgi:predicted molibdopterin-dependent oxidoreductase YjgC